MFDTNGNLVVLPPLMPIQGDDGQFRALHTIGTVADQDKTVVGQFPNRSATDSWAFPVPLTPGCYTLRVSVTDALQRLDRPALRRRRPARSDRRPAEPTAGTRRSKSRVRAATGRAHDNQHPRREFG